MVKVNDIKFRAWDKKDFKIRPVLGMSFVHGAISVKLNNEEYLQDDASRFEIMQYTGLKDKNGVDIYEGDILNGVYYGETELEEKIKGEVYYTNRGTWDCCSFLLGDLNETCEVIGNIYNN